MRLRRIGRGLAAVLVMVLASAALADSVPAGFAPVSIPIRFTRMNGFLLTASGDHPHPAVIFLHGYPGDERNLDLAQAVRRVGYHALYFDYRGTWGSGGQFSYSNALEDVATSVRFLRLPEIAERFHIDPERIILLGQGMGGGLALLSAAEDDGLACVASLSTWNAGGAAQRWAADADERGAWEAMFRQTTDPNTGPIRGDAGQIMQEIEAHAGEWDLGALMPTLHDRRLLLAADTEDAVDAGTQKALTDALAAAGAGQLRQLTFDDDAEFSSHRAELADIVIEWLGRNCVVGQPPPPPPPAPPAPP
jgi:pimeloyl-ACP methyl ester carboxylesterase